MQSNDIKKILELVKEKDPSGFDLLYQHYFRLLFSIAYSVLNSEDDSYDVIQSVMLRLYQLDQNLFPSDHELSWLKTVVKNEALMHLRREKSTVPLEETADFPVLDQRIEDFGRYDPQGDRTNAVRSHRDCPMDLCYIHQETAPLPDGTRFPGADLWRRVWVSTGAVFSSTSGSTGRHRDQQHPRCGACDFSLAGSILGFIPVCCGRLYSFSEIFRPNPNKTADLPHLIR